ncbi:hypothetical protein [Nocardioides sp. Kera G14]|uniref:hypothetical protein n=1 Tax=Nocardioides sp. Kera G14 TaxID=2884264 RepID=UPI001D12900F|nr:hypothetical protein [Nocardioides sp. Kera G14]UDY22461.1 hypothetical protein LH076_10250 [Nocardioides sp. Kera G14]
MSFLLRLLCITALISWLSVCVISSSVLAAGCSGTLAGSAGAEDQDFLTNIDITTHCGNSDDSFVDAVPGHWVHEPVCKLGGSTMCDADGQAVCADGTPMETVYFQPDEGVAGGPRSNCPTDANAADPGPTVSDVIHALERVPLPQSVLQIQPPDGETLVNFDTNFLTEAEPFDTSVTLVGHTVDFKIHPARFTWHYGDGETAEGTEPGRLYPNLDVTHRYRKKGTVAASVDTTWAADYRIDGGAWATVPDTVTMAGAPQQLRIRTATPLLAGS